MTDNNEIKDLFKQVQANIELIKAGVNKTIDTLQHVKRSNELVKYKYLYHAIARMVGEGDELLSINTDEDLIVLKRFMPDEIIHFETYYKGHSIATFVPKSVEGIQTWEEALELIQPQIQAAKDRTDKKLSKQ